MQEPNTRRKKSRSWLWWQPKKFARNHASNEQNNTAATTGSNNHSSSISSDNEINNSTDETGGAVAMNPYADMSSSMRVLKSTKSEKSYEIASTASILSKPWANQVGAGDTAESVPSDEHEDVVGSWLETNKPSQSSTSLPMLQSQKAENSSTLPARRSCEHNPTARPQTWQQWLKVIFNQQNLFRLVYSHAFQTKFSLFKRKSSTATQ